jgi:hypothetical protein
MSRSMDNGSKGSTNAKSLAIVVINPLKIMTPLLATNERMWESMNET